MQQARKTIAVIFGGASPEFDVSIVSAQQLMDAADPQKYDVVPVLMDFENRLYTGRHLRNAALFRPLPPGREEITIAWGDRGPEIRWRDSDRVRQIDCVLPLLHGRFGEDGRIQGQLELNGIPFSGFSTVDAAVAMRKDLAKLVAGNVGVPVLPHVLVTRQQLGDMAKIEADVEKNLGYPVILKPASLGSSIGISVAKSRAELEGCIQFVLSKDKLVVIEPKVPNLVEFNVAVRSAGDKIMVSAIEKPKPTTDLLDFSEKYLSGGGGDKGSTLPSQGMLSLTRDINPRMSKQMRADIHEYARRVFDAMGRRGAPRLDFLCDSKTKQLWFNEINPIPGSYGYFLWERAAQNPLLFPELIEHLVNEALHSNLKQFDDPVPEDARLLTR